MADKIQRSFTGGEISPSLHSRADQIKYTTGLALCENNIIRAQGGVYSRPGTEFVGEVDDSTKKARLIPFSFNTEQTYILVFEDLKMQVIRDGAYVLNQAGTDRFELTTPYTEAQLDRLKFTQDADVMTIVHPDHEPRDLGRFADNVWQLNVIDFSVPIQAPDWSTDLSESISNITNANPGVVTTSSTHGFDTGDVVTFDSVGGMTALNDNGYVINVLSTTTFELVDVDTTGFGIYSSGGNAVRKSIQAFGDGAGDHDKTYTYVVTAVSGDVESVASVVRTIATKSLSTTAGVRLAWDPIGTADYYRVYKDPSNNTGIYGWIGDSENNQFDDFNIAPLTSDAPPQSREVFADVTASITNIVENGSNLDVTAVGHGFNSGDLITITGVVGPDGINDQSYTVTYIDDDTFSFVNPLASPIAAYTSGGTAARQGNKPSTVAYYQQRRIFANTKQNPQTVYSTQTAVYDSLRFSVPARDTDALTFSLRGQQVNEIRHVIDMDGLLLLTSGAEWSTTEGQDQVLTPSTIGARVQTYYGSSWVSPQIIGDTVVFIQDKGSRVRDVKYQFVDDKYSGTDLSIMAEHLFEDHQITEMAYSQEPYSILWMVRSDGRVLGLTYQREHQVWAWHQHDFGGEVESIASIAEDNRDVVYLSIKRSIDGADVRYVERLQARQTSSVETTWCVDSGLRYEGAAATTISGLDHLTGESVVAVADGVEYRDLPVTSGEITLPRAASIVTVGIPYTPVIELLDIDLASSAETIKAKKLSVSRVTVEIEKSRGGWVGPINDEGNAGQMREIKPRFDSDVYGAIQLKTFKQEVSIEPQWNQGGGIRIEQRAAFPLTILSVTPYVDVS